MSCLAAHYKTVHETSLPVERELAHLVFYEIRLVYFYWKCYGGRSRKVDSKKEKDVTLPCHHHDTNQDQYAFKFVL